MKRRAENTQWTAQQILTGGLANISEAAAVNLPSNPACTQNDTDATTTSRNTKSNKQSTSTNIRWLQTELNFYNLAVESVIQNGY